jgi:hypothetical protein
MNTKRKITLMVLHFSLVNFLLVGILGVVLRWFLISPIPGFYYRNWMHAHSHLAILGWVYPILFIVILSNYEWDSIRSKQLKVLFIIMEISVVGMLVTFPLYGYGILPISFSTLHMVVSFYLMGIIWKLMRKNGGETSNLLIKIALIFMLISAIGPLVLGPLSVMGYKKTIWYDLSIYFYLHFQYNGFFILAVIGLLVLIIGKSSGIVEMKFKGWTSGLLIIVFTTTTFALSAVEMMDKDWIYFAGGFGAILQLMFFIMLFKWCWKSRDYWLPLLPSTTRFLWTVSAVAIATKVLLQLLTAIPFISENTYPVRDLVIAYLHLVLLGAISTFLLGLLIMKNWIPPGKLTLLATRIFVSGIAATEFVLIYRGLVGFGPASGMLFNYLLLTASLILLVGILLFTISSSHNSSNT